MNKHKIKVIGGLTKWLAAGIGWALFGPIGAIIGLALGVLFEMSEIEQLMQQGRQYPTGVTTTGDFAMTLIVLASTIMKADDKVVKAELDYVKKFFVQNFGEESAREILLVLRDVLKRDVPLEEVCKQVDENMGFHTKLHLLHFLYGIAAADGYIHPQEQNLINYIAARIGIDTASHKSIQSMFTDDTDAAYQMLDISSNASDEEIKKAYRRMAQKYHPDKVSHLGEDFKKSANEKFQKINQAYKTIKDEREKQNKANF